MRFILLIEGVESKQKDFALWLFHHSLQHSNLLSIEFKCRFSCVVYHIIWSHCQKKQNIDWFVFRISWCNFLNSHTFEKDMKNFCNLTELDVSWRTLTDHTIHVCFFIINILIIHSHFVSLCCWQNDWFLQGDSFALHQTEFAGSFWMQWAHTKGFWILWNSNKFVYSTT
jgi:hypothetical protein